MLGGRRHRATNSPECLGESIEGSTHNTISPSDLDISSLVWYSASLLMGKGSNTSTGSPKSSIVIICWNGGDVVERKGDVMMSGRR